MEAKVYLKHQFNLLKRIRMRLDPCSPTKNRGWTLKELLLFDIFSVVAVFTGSYHNSSLESINGGEMFIPRNELFFR
jgi:hypothetical protein